MLADGLSRAKLLAARTQISVGIIAPGQVPENLSTRVGFPVVPFSQTSKTAVVRDVRHLCELMIMESSHRGEFDSFVLWWVAS